MYVLINSRQYLDSIEYFNTFHVARTLNALLTKSTTTRQPVKSDLPRFWNKILTDFKQISFVDSVNYTLQEPAASIKYFSFLGLYFLLQLIE
jgi:hypothetical protein